jgi:hypothetical protein
MNKPERVGVSAWWNEGTATFWQWAKAEKERAPAVVLPLIDGNLKPVEVPDEDAVAIAAWAQDTIGSTPVE